MSHQQIQRKMMELDDHTYAVGKLQLITLGEEAGTLGLDRGTAVQAFTRLYKDRILYHSAAYPCSDGKRDDTMCVYHWEGQICYGQIMVFAVTPEQCKLFDLVS